MSIEVMTRVWNHSRQSGTALLLLLAIADCANDEGEAWPGGEFLSKRIRKTKSYTRELIEKLIKSHELRRTHTGGKGQGDSHHYKITVKGRLRGGLGEVTTLKNRLEPLEPIEPFKLPLYTTTTNPVVAVDDDWDLSRLVELGRVTKARTAEITALDPAPSASAYVAHYLYGMTIHKINAPAHFAAKRIVEQLTAGEPFEQLADHGPKWLTECLHWIFTGGVEYFDGLTPQALALRNYLPTDVAARMIPRAFDELGLSAYLPKQEPPEPVGEFVSFVPPERPMLDEWQQAIEQMRPHYRPPTLQSLEQCKLVGRENGTMLIEVPNSHMLQWFEVQRMSAGLADYGIAVAFKLRENYAEG